ASGGQAEAQALSAHLRDRRAREAECASALVPARIDARVTSHAGLGVGGVAVHGGWAGRVPGVDVGVDAVIAGVDDHRRPGRAEIFGMPTAGDGAVDVGGSHAVAGRPVRLLHAFPRIAERRRTLWAIGRRVAG